MVNGPKILMLGAGLASNALTLKLLHSGFRGEIHLFDKKNQPEENKTWCFWGQEELPEYLHPLISKKWRKWQFSHGPEKCEHTAQNVRDYYCCIKGSDFFQYAQEVIRNNSNVKCYFGNAAIPLQSTADKVAVKVGDTRYDGDIGFDSRPDYGTKLTKGLYQCFVGVWLELDEKLFNRDTAGLMLNLNSGITSMHGNMKNPETTGTEFLYLLPHNEKSALLELTVFSKEPQNLTEMKRNLEIQITADYPNKRFTIKNWEQGILPMSTELASNDIHSLDLWQKIGVCAGMIRPSTGYAFIPIQRWANATAKSIVAGKTDFKHCPINQFYLWLDEIFLRVLKKEPELGPRIFMSLAQKTSSDCFARFMTERATFSDLLRVIAAMPKRPFVRALLQ